MSKKQTEKKAPAKKTTAKKPAAKKESPKKEKVVLNPTKYYILTLDKDTKHMKAGKYTLKGDMAQVLLDKGIGSVKA